MTFKEGDLVVCVNSYFPELIGRVFNITRRSFVWHDCWETSPPQFTNKDPNIAIVFVESHLRPIRDPGDDAVDEVIQRIGKPEQETA